MAVNTYLVHLHDEFLGDDDARADIAEQISLLGGFTLMATSAGSLIAAFDESHLAFIKRNRTVAFCGGVSLNPDGKAAERLRALFAHNVAAQLNARSRPPTLTGSTPTPEFPEGYKPLRWRDRYAS